MDIKHELNRAINIIMPMANMNCVEIQTTLNSYYIKGESQLLQQCLLNITKNCIEAMPEGGNLSISTNKEGSGKLVIKVKDTGKGMTDEQLARIGEPYFTTKGREGTGLGMMAAIQIISILNGTLEVKSVVNKGTEFTLYFPLINSSLNEVAITQD
ncbi:ATP-binding protein [Bacillus sp. FJAT-45350]|uniref:ATP-binding protein n=1 Tax=Bacillus sp. FJAT-45350 TaxID=2011014 RepID=UPI00359C9349